MNDLKKKFKEGNISKADFIKSMYEYHKTLFEYSKFIKNTDIKKIEIVDNKVIMTSRQLGIKILCNSKDERIPPIEVLNFDYYEKNDSSMIFKLIENDFTIFDIGANVGWYSIAFSKVKNNVSIFAFEPILKTYKNLVFNTKLNSVKNIKTFQNGFHNKNTTLNFYYYPEGSVNASSKNLAPERRSIKLKYKVYSLDDFVRKNKVSKIDFIKCDVEGAELFVFEGAKKSIKKWKPIIFTEMLRKWSAKFDYHPNEIIEFLKNKGYLCFFTKNHKLVEIKEIYENTIETNFFFLHREKHSEQISTYS